MPALRAVLRPVATTNVDRTARGVLDMGSNVSEWTVAHDAGGRPVPCVKGGSSLIDETLLPGYRDLFLSTHRSHALGEALPFCGFRCARDVPPLDLQEFLE